MDIDLQSGKVRALYRDAHGYGFLFFWREAVRKSFFTVPVCRGRNCLSVVIAIAGLLIGGLKMKGQTRRSS